MLLAMAMKFMLDYLLAFKILLTTREQFQTVRQQPSGVGAKAEISRNKPACLRFVVVFLALRH